MIADDTAGAGRSTTVTSGHQNKINANNDNGN